MPWRLPSSKLYAILGVVTATATLSDRRGGRAPEPDPMEGVWAELADAAGELNRAHYRLVTITAKALETKHWFGEGIKSPEHWLILRAGLDRGRACMIVRLARRLTELPTAAAALSAGQLSLEQTSAVARHTPADHERAVTEFALNATVPQIVRATARYSFNTNNSGTENGSDTSDAAIANGEPDNPASPSPIDTPPAESVGAPPDSDAVEPESARPASLHMSTDADGRFRLRYEAPAHLGALVEAALREAKDRLFRDRHGDSTTTPEVITTYTHQVTLGDALAEVCAAALASQGAPDRRERYRALIHLGTDGAWLSGGPRLPQHIVNGLTCDGVLRPVWETEGAPVNVGRTHRVVPYRTKALLRDRDRGCRFPGCPQAGSTAGYIEAHHIRHWLAGGRTDTDNLVCLCPWHHDRHHDGDFLILGNPDLPEHAPGSLHFTTPTGTPITAGARSSAPTPDAARPTSSSGTAQSQEETPPSAAAPMSAQPPALRLVRTEPYGGPTGEPLHVRWVHFRSNADYAAARPATATAGGEDTRRRSATSTASHTGHPGASDPPICDTAICDPPVREAPERRPAVGDDG